MKHLFRLKFQELYETFINVTHSPKLPSTSTIPNIFIMLAFENRSPYTVQCHEWSAMSFSPCLRGGSCSNFHN